MLFWQEAKNSGSGFLLLALHLSLSLWFGKVWQVGGKVIRFPPSNPTSSLSLWFGGKVVRSRGDLECATPSLPRVEWSCMKLWESNMRQRKWLPLPLQCPQKASMQKPKQNSQQREISSAAGVGQAIFAYFWFPAGGLSGNQSVCHLIGGQFLLPLWVGHSFFRRCHHQTAGNTCTIINSKIFTCLINATC